MDEAFTQSDAEYLIDLRTDDPSINREIQQLLAYQQQFDHRDCAFLRGEYIGQFVPFTDSNTGAIK